MGVVLSILAWLGIVLGVILLLLLVLPLGYRMVGVCTEETLEGTVVAWWAFGLISVRLSLVDTVDIYLVGVRIKRIDLASREKRRKAHEEELSPKEDKEAKEQKRRPSVRRLWSNRDYLFSLAGRVLRLVHLHGSFRGRVGLGDPARTAWLATAQQTLVDGVGSVAFDVTYDYVQQTMELQIDMRGWLWPLQVVGFGIGLMVSPRLRRVLRPA